MASWWEFGGFSYLWALTKAFKSVAAAPSTDSVMPMTAKKKQALQPALPKKSFFGGMLLLLLLYLSQAIL